MTTFLPIAISDNLFITEEYKCSPVLQHFITNFGSLKEYALRQVYFNYADRKLVIKGKKQIKEGVSYLFKNEKILLDKLNYIFCSDEYLLQINRQFLNHDFYTDIITFDLSETNKIIGEIYISLDRVKINAIENKAPFKEELMRVIFHGALHLCGYKDKKKTETEIMRSKEDYYLTVFQSV